MKLTFVGDEDVKNYWVSTPVDAVVPWQSIGIPQVVGNLAKEIYIGLPESVREVRSREFWSSIPVGVKISGKVFWAKMALWIINDPAHGIVAAMSHAKSTSPLPQRAFAIASKMSDICGLVAGGSSIKSQKKEISRTYSHGYLDWCPLDCHEFVKAIDALMPSVGKTPIFHADIWRNVLWYLASGREALRRDTWIYHDYHLPLNKLRGKMPTIRDVLSYVRENHERLIDLAVTLEDCQARVKWAADTLLRAAMVDVLGEEYMKAVHEALCGVLRELETVL